MSSVLNWHYSGIILLILGCDYQNNKLENMPFMHQSKCCLRKSSRFAAKREVQLISKRKYFHDALPTVTNTQLNAECSACSV
jgi:hypothetical protein